MVGIEKRDRPREDRGALTFEIYNVGWLYSTNSRQRMNYVLAMVSTQKNSDSELRLTSLYESNIQMCNVWILL